ncbi:MAG TPA: galactose oxidase-like domain-containing protein [Candidatus Acidoferrum sp.]|nr:galactose oxidase-like domain-containing protein [Candidatus Acidoferrum sp.]
MPFSRPARLSLAFSKVVQYFLPVAVAAICFASLPGLAAGQASLQGQWQTLPNLMPINPVHAALLHNGKVLVVSGSGNLPTNTNLQAGVFDPQTGTVTTQPVNWDMFCNGMVVLPDGRAFVNGGTLQYDPFHGELRSAVYDLTTGAFNDLQSMAHGRWYPTVTTLADGRVMTFSGLSETGGTNTAVEIYSVGAGWSTQIGSPFTPPLYPRMHLLPNGKVFYSGSTTQSRIFDPVAKTWSGVVATTNYSGTRTYGTSVLLPLTPANNYKPVVIIMGGGNPSTATTELIDLSAATPSWTYGPSMSQPRIEMNATILPSGKIIALGGSLNDEDTGTASLNADLYDPATNTFSSAGKNAFARLYHSNSLLLPDGTVLFIGGNPARGTYEQHMEIYSPPYLFNPDGTLAARPTITGVPSSAIGYGSAFQVQSPDAANVASVVLMRPGAPTHAFDMEQRMVAMNFTAGSGVLNVTAPPNGNIAPPGYYMLFILNSSGVPSVAQFVQLTPAPADQPPTGTITSPATDVTITAGQSVFFSGSGTDPDGTVTAYSWSFPSGNPSSSSLATPGSVIYNTPGTFAATLTVTDNAGLTDPNPPSRHITVTPAPDFGISASPSSQSVIQGNGTNYTITITPANGFSGTVSFSASGLPSGAAATFTPSTVSGQGSTTLNVATASSTPVGSYTLTITGSSGALTHSVTAKLTVNSSADFSVSASPASLSILRGHSGTYTVSVAALGGFAGSVSLKATGLPSRVSASFNPVTVNGSGSSALTVHAGSKSRAGTYNLTITGTSGNLVHSTSVTLVLK